jgi:hypothetical protein
VGRLAAVVWITVAVLAWAYLFAPGPAPAPTQPALANRPRATEVVIEPEHLISDVPDPPPTLVAPTERAPTQLSEPTMRPLADIQQRGVVANVGALGAVLHADPAGRQTGTLRDGQQVDILETTTLKGATWTHVQADGLDGWVASRLVEPAAEASQPGG